MDQAGSRTQLPTLIVAGGTLLLLLFGTGLLENIPMPAIGAVVAVAIVPLLGLPVFRMLWRRDRFEFLIAAVCFVVTLFVGAIPGIFTALALALINLARRAANPTVEVLASDGDPHSALVETAPPGTSTAPGVLVIRISAPLFFANGTVVVDAVKTLVRTATQDIHHVVLDFEAVTDIDVTAGESIAGLHTWLVDHDVALAVSRARPEIIGRMHAWGLLDAVPVHPTNRAALAAIREQ